MLLFGAGEAGIGIADMIVTALQREGLSGMEARDRVWLVDSKGLVLNCRPDLSNEKRRFAHEYEFVSDHLSAINGLRPTAIIGVSGRRGIFTPLLARMAQIHERPMIFALSNPTSKSECAAEEAYRLTGGRAIFASGSPFSSVTLDGKRFVPAQGNNAYIFPGVGMGVIASESRLVVREMFLEAAGALAAEVSESDLAEGRVYPPLHKIRDVSLAIAVTAAQVAYDQGLARAPKPDDLRAHIKSLMFEPSYPSYV